VPARDGEEPPAAPPAQQIIALRVVAPPAEPFDGAALRAAIEAEGFTFGRYQIFHRLDAAGRTVFSLASLKEPGTFDVATMGRASFRGVALFVVLPGPLPGGDAFDALLAAARAIAGRLGGLLQDERGVALGPVRIGQLRAAAAAIEPSRAPTPDG
jgi:cell division protein ZipA